MLNDKQKIIVILGPTASGKTGLAVKTAFKYNGEIVSADSRQVYIGMDVGSGKDLPDYHLEFSATKKLSKDFDLPCKKTKNKTEIDIPYHLIDVVKPNTEFSLGKFYRKANVAISDIIKRGRLPIIAGGTGLWLQALVDGYDLSPVKPDKELREKLEKLSVDQVYKRLEELDKKFAKGLNNSERNNKRRMIRYIEMKRQNAECRMQKKTNDNYEYLLIGLEWPKEVLEKRIYKRLIQRLENEDMMGEVGRLHNQGVSWKRLESFGLEYKYLAMHLQGKIDYNQMVEELFIATRQFAKRQRQWFKRWEKQGAKIHWVKSKKEGNELVKNFLK